jgi:hypothetical protein
MTDNYKATPEQWQASKRRADNGNIIDIRLLELRARIEQLEVQARNYPAIPDSSTPPPVATDEELWKLWAEFKFAAFRIIYNLGVAHGQAGSREVAEPAPVTGGLAAALRLDAERRPEPPPTLKEQAIAELEKVDMLWDTGEFSQNALDSLDTIRRALEALPND